MMEEIPIKIISTVFPKVRRFYATVKQHLESMFAFFRAGKNIIFKMLNKIR